MKDRARKWKKHLILLGVALGVIALWLLVRPSGSLMDRASVVTPIRGSAYRWLNDEEVLFQNNEGKATLCRRSTGETRPDVRQVDGDDGRIVRANGYVFSLLQSTREPSYTVVRTRSGSTTPPDSWHVKAPWRGSRVTDVAVSPMGDRVAYTVEGVPPPLYPDFVYRCFASLKKPERTEALWVSSLDGSAAYEVGRLTEDDRFAMMDGPKLTLTHVRWLPGGRYVSFLRGNNLYVIGP